MPDWLQHNLPEGWSDQHLIVAGIILTVATAVLSLIAVAIVVVRIPSNCFVGDQPPRVSANSHPFIRWPAVILKNLLGVSLVALGALMSLPGVPGQGFSRY